jgi:hypothetical protein
MERVYSAREAAAILASAARRQGVEGPDGVVGLTLSEIEQVASEAGIDPAHVAAAAADLAEPARRERVLGFQAEASRSRVIAGPVTDETWGQIVAELRRSFGAVGITSDVGSVRAWSSAASEREVPVRASLEPAGDHARLTLTQRPGDIIAGLTAAGVLVSTVLGVSTLLSEAGSSSFGVGALIMALVIYFAVRTWYAGSIRRTEVQFEHALDRAARLAGSVESASPEATTAAPLPDSQTGPRVSLDDLPDIGADAAGDDARRLRT